MASTTLTHSSTIPATLLYGSSGPLPTHNVGEFSADPDVRQLMRWPSRKPTYDELCSLAGLFEGEGWFGERRVSIFQREREILDRVRAIVGGRVGGPCTKMDARTGQSHSRFIWYSYGPRVRGIARTLFHLLSSRRQAQARVFLRIPRFEAPPELDRDDPTRLLWDWAPEDELGALEW